MLLFALACSPKNSPHTPPVAPEPAPAAAITALPSGPEAMTPVLVEDGDGLLLLWQEPGLVRVSTWDAGWSVPETVIEREGLVQNWADFPQLARGNDGALYASWLVSAGGGHFYEVHLGRNEGDGWTELGKLHTDDVQAEHGFVSLLPEGDGVRAWWLDGRDMPDGAPMSFRTALVDATGAHDERVLDERVCDCCRTAAVATPEGPVVFYRDRSDDEVRDIGFLGASSGKLDDGWTIQGCPVNGPVARYGDALYTTWFTGADEQPRVRVSVGLGAPFTVAPAAGEASPLGRSQLVADDEGAVVLWLDSDGGVNGRRVGDGTVGPTTPLGHTEAVRKSGFPTAVRVEDDLFAIWTVPGQGLTANRLPLAAFQQTGGVQFSEATEGANPTLAHLDGLSEFEGPVLVAAWATWCAPCREELLVLEALHQAGVPVVALNVDTAERGEQVDALVAELGLTLEVVKAPEAATALGLTALPWSGVFDAEGALVWSESGLLDGEGAWRDHL
jgi:thiol-disulfide isomerase/thioredoxin